MAGFSWEIPHYVIARGDYVTSEQMSRGGLRSAALSAESNASENRLFYLYAETVVDKVHRFSADGLRWTQRNRTETRFDDDRRLVSSKCTENQTPLIVYAPQYTTNRHDADSGSMILLVCIWNVMS